MFGVNFAKKTFDKKKADFVGIFWANFARNPSNFAAFCIFCEFHWILQIYLNFAALLPVKYQKPGLGLPENLSFLIEILCWTPWIH